MLPLLVGHHESSAARGGNHLVAVERQHAKAAEGATHAAVVARAEALGGVLYHRYAIFVGHGQDVVDAGGHAVEIHHHYGLRLAPRGGDAVGDGVVEELRVHIPAVRLRIDKHGRGAQISHGV